MPRPRRASNIKPTRAEIESYYRTLKGAATEGDAMAAGMLLLNDTANRYVVLHEKPDISMQSALRLAVTAVLHLPRSEWHVLPEDVEDLAEAFLTKGTELALKEQKEQKEAGKCS